jgi:uncharacterized membrane protein YtjA (UPF0391 family)
MLAWIVAFLLLALLAALFGFGGIATAFAGIAKILFVLQRCRERAEVLKVLS